MTTLQSSPALYWPLARTASEKQFKMQHHLRHYAYDKAASSKGIALSGIDLSGEVTQDWLWRHSVRHRTYRTVIGKAGAYPTVDLASLDWEDENAVVAWQHFHAGLHADLDEYFGITGAL